MPIFDVTHIIGDQGYGEKEILTSGVEADTALDAIYKVAPSTCRLWAKKGDNWDESFLFNPDAPNRSEDYCDYYHSKLTHM